MNDRSAADLPQAEEVARQVRELTERALEEVDSGDGAALERTLQARAALIDRMGVLLDALLAGGSRQALADRRFGPLREAANAALLANRTLVRRVASAFDDLGGRIRQLQHEEAAVGAYAASAPRSSSLDLRR